MHPDDAGLEVARKVAERFGDGVTPELVVDIFAIRESILGGGDPLGCVRVDEANGIIAIRINQGLYSWVFVTPEIGEFWANQDASAVPEYPIKYQLPPVKGKSGQEGKGG